MTKLELLYAQQKKMFAEVCELVAREFGYGEFTTLKGEDRDQVENEAGEYIKEWEETVEFRTIPAIRPMTPLRRLLSRYQDICERILDERDIEIGLWAYKKRARRRAASF